MKELWDSRRRLTEESLAKLPDYLVSEIPLEIDCMLQYGGDVFYIANSKFLAIWGIRRPDLLLPIYSAWSWKSEGMPRKLYVKLFRYGLSRLTTEYPKLYATTNHPRLFMGLPGVVIGNMWIYNGDQQ